MPDLGLGVIDIVDGQIELVVVMFDFAAILRTTVCKNTQQRKFLIHEEQKNLVIEQVGGCNRRLGRIELSEGNLGIGVDKGLLINDGCLKVQWSVVDKTLNNHLKEASRTRDIPLTKAISRVLDQAMDRKSKSSVLVFQTKTGLTLYDRPIREARDKACTKAGVKRVVPYALRHCFVSYCEIMKINKPRIIGLMGHAD